MHYAITNSVLLHGTYLSSIVDNEAELPLAGTGCEDVRPLPWWLREAAALEPWELQLLRRLVLRLG